jgi:hypothetical protein
MSASWSRDDIFRRRACTGVLYIPNYDAPSSILTDSLQINGGEDGVRPGRRFAMYEAYMDGNARHGTRAYNTRAARLLALPQSYGPIIVVKMTCTKSFMGGVQDIVKVPLTQAELQSSAFQRRRQEYSVKKEVDDEFMMDLFPCRMGGGPGIFGLH